MQNKTISLDDLNVKVELIERYLSDDSYNDHNFKELVSYYYNQIQNNKQIKSVVSTLKPAIGEYTVITEPLYIMVAARYLKVRYHRDPTDAQILNIL